jgi:hypothetical protein
VTATFDPTLVTAKDRLRAALGDRDMTAPLRTDEEYWAQLALTPDERLATAVMAEGLAAEYAFQPTTVSNENGTVSWAGRITAWQALAARLYAELKASAATGFGSARAERAGEIRSEYRRDERFWRHWDGD